MSDTSSDRNLHRGLFYFDRRRNALFQMHDHATLSWVSACYSRAEAVEIAEDYKTWRPVVIPCFRLRRRPGFVAR